MLSRCIFCNAGFPANQTLDHFPLGRRIAFDGWRGRLWAICAGCNRWTLAPFEERWEALEELERLARDRGHALARTANIALIRAGSVELVRVGRAPLREESWWRYGEEMLRRSQHSKRVAFRGRIMDGMFMALLIGIPYTGWSNPQTWIDRARRHQFGRYVRRGHQHCVRCGARLKHIRFSESANLQLVRNGADIALRSRCPSCGRQEGSGILITGAEAGHVLRRVLAYHNYSGAPEPVVEQATGRLESRGDANVLLQEFAARAVPIGGLSHVDVLALEIAANQEIERRLLEAELAALEKQWREEEHIAAIVDGELTDVRRPAED
jgi:hypothetical protein